MGKRTLGRDEGWERMRTLGREAGGRIRGNENMRKRRRGRGKMGGDENKGQEGRWRERYHETKGNRE